MNRLLPLLFLSLLFLSCKEESSSEKIIHLWIFNNSPSPLEDMNKILKGFHVENPGLKVEVTVLDWGNGFSKIVLAAATRKGPDVIQVPSTWAASLTDIGALMSLDSVANIWADSNLFINGARETMKPRNSEHITSLPWFLDVRPFYYRQDVLDSLKIDPNTINSRETFADVLQRIRRARISINGKVVNPMAYPAKNDWNIVHNVASWIFSAGGSFLTEDLSKSNLLSQETLDGIHFYLDFVRNGHNDYSNLDKTTAGVSSDFDQGRTAFIGETTSKSMYLDNHNFLQANSNAVAMLKYGCMIPPTAKRGMLGKYFLGGSNLGVFSSTPVKRESLALLRYLTTQSDVQFQFSRVSGFLPSLTETYDLPYFSENKNRKVFQKIVESGVSYPAISSWSAIETDVLAKRFNNIFNIIAGSEGRQWPQSEIDRELRAADTEINNIISRDAQRRRERTQ
ncbi:MAG: extracellular solute-binding protein [Fibromonadaceae bacterium]|jgi:multiple sugar transport system substrate-binding protein|nr:extracellular solute-binding protein [Fibromonadaceae bacterium]